MHEDHGALPDRAALALRGDGLALVAFESATAVRREIAARSVDAEGRLGPVLVLSRAAQASGPAVATLPSGEFAVAWHEAAFPTLRTVVVTVSLREPGAPGGRQDRPLRHIK